MITEDNTGHVCCPLKLKAKPFVKVIPPIARDVAGRAVVHHLLSAHPVVVSSPVRLGQRVGPEEGRLDPDH